MAVTFSQILFDGGLGRALIQRKDVTDRDTNVVFWTSLAVSLVLYGILFGLAPWFSRVYKEPQVLPVLRVMGLQLVVMASIDAQSAILQRVFNFRALFWSRLAMSLTPLLIAVPAAVRGFGVWALVIGSLAGSLAQAAVIWQMHPWRPSRSYHASALREMWRFGAWVLMEGVLGWFYVWADSAILGAYLGVHDLGVYRTGWTLVMLVFALPLTSMLPIVYSAFCHLREDPVVFGGLFAKALRLVAVVAVLLTVGLFFLSEPLGQLLFGSKWQGLGRVIAYLAVLQGWSMLIGGLNTEAYRAVGRPDVFPKVYLVCLAYCVPTYLLSAPHGLSFFLKARVAIAFLSLPIHMWLVGRILHLSPSVY
jgi:PST family polysaccharide transporter